MIRIVVKVNCSDLSENYQIINYNYNFYNMQLLKVSSTKIREVLRSLPVVPHKAVAEVSKIGNL
jgi:hypothetical protein